MEFNQAIDDFLVWLRVRRQLSPRTVTNYYGYALRNVVAPWCGGRGVDQVEQLTDSEVDRFSMELEDRHNRAGEPLHLATRAAYLKALRHFLTWAHDQAGIEVNPQRVGLPRLRRLEKDVLSEQEMQELEDAASNERDKLLIRLMVETGGRIGEVAGLHLDDLVERERRYWFVRFGGKTGQRLAPISAELYRRLRAYSQGKTGRPRVRSPWLFLERVRRPGGDYERLTESGIYRAVRDAAARSDLDRKRIHPHLLRASAITRMCARGMHPAMVSQVTGVSVQVIATHYLYPSQVMTWEAAMKALEQP
jgi:site-specific recombinase XerD